MGYSRCSCIQLDTYGYRVGYRPLYTVYLYRSIYIYNHFAAQIYTVELTLIPLYPPFSAVFVRIPVAVCCVVYPAVSACIPLYVYAASLSLFSILYIHLYRCRSTELSSVRRVRALCLCLCKDFFCTHFHMCHVCTFSQKPVTVTSHWNNKSLLSLDTRIISTRKNRTL